MLRGQPGAEIAIALEAFHCDAAIVTPAFPAMKRLVENGWLRIAGDPDFAPVHLPTRLSLSGPHLTFADAATDRHLDEIVAAGLARGGRILWAGSAGLASALARTLGDPLEPALPPALARGVLFAIGSDHPVTLEQQRRLQTCRQTVDSSDPDCIREALLNGAHVVLRFPPKNQLGDLLRAVYRHAAALVLSDGDTAAAVCCALGATHIELAGEIAPGIPHGLLDGSTPIVTKSGAFGAPDALVRIADFFQCP